MLTTKQIKTIIRDKFAADLPALLTTAVLSDFEDYLISQPSNREKRQLGMYTEGRTNSTDFREFRLIIQAQLPRIADWEQNYDDVIFPYIEQEITAELLGFITRESVESDLYPVDQTGTSFNFYVLTFSSPLDDCEED